MTDTTTTAITAPDAAGATEAPPRSPRQDRDRDIWQFMNDLERLVRNRREPDRAALAALRSGLGMDPGSAIAMYPLVGHHLRSGDPVTGYLTWSERTWNDTLFIVASLFGLHPVPRPTGDDQTSPAAPPADEQARTGTRRNRSFLASLPPRTGDKDRDQAIDRRVVALLNADRDALPTMLRQAVGLLEDGASVDWAQLTRDLLDWDHADRPVQKRWAAAWWTAPTRNEIANAADDAGGLSGNETLAGTD